MFSDGAVFYLDGGINTHNWSRSNSHWTVEKSLNSTKVMVWATIGVPGIIELFFLEDNVSGEKYLHLLTEEFYPAFSSYPNTLKPHFACKMGPHLIGSSVLGTDSIRTWLTVRLEEVVLEPQRSPDLTPIGVLSVGSYQGQGLCEKLPKLGRAHEFNFNSLSRNDGRKWVSKREELEEETENGY